jgi:hypothetical protein
MDALQFIVTPALPVTDTRRSFEETVKVASSPASDSTVKGDVIAEIVAPPPPCRWAWTYRM